jgi:O-antigen/teichoic acid export membrane protein
MTQVGRLIAKIVGALVPERTGGAGAKLVRNAAWSVAGQFAAVAGLLVGTRLLTDRLTPDVFGSVSLVIGVATLGNNLFCAPLLQAGLRFYPESAARAELATLRAILARDLGATTLVLVCVLLIGGVGATRSTGLPTSAFVVLGALVAIEAARTFDYIFLLSAEKHSAYAIWNGLEAWLRPLAAVVAILVVGPSVPAVLGGYVVGTLTLYLVMHFAGRRRYDGQATEERRKVIRREAWTYAWPLVPVAIVGWICSLSDRYIIVWFHGVRDVGIYSAAYGLAGRPIAMLSTTLTSVFRPPYFNAFAAERFDDARHAFRSWVLTTIIAGAFVVVVYVFGAGLIVRIALNIRYRSVAPLLWYIVSGYVLMALSQVLNTASMAYKRTSASTISETSGALASFAFGIPLIAAFGIKGAAWAVPLYYGVQCLIAARLGQSNARTHKRLLEQRR